MKRCVYLAGPTEIEGDTWRTKAGEKLEQMDFEPIDPMRGEQLRRVGKHLESDVPDEAIVMRDLNDLRRTALTGGICLMSLDTTSDGRRPIGTLFELMWCWLHGVPVVAVMGRNTDPMYRTHPWVKTMVTYKATSMTDALKFIEAYFA